MGWRIGARTCHRALFLSLVVDDGLRRARTADRLFSFLLSLPPHSSPRAYLPSTRARPSPPPRPCRTGWTRTRACSPSKKREKRARKKSASRFRKKPDLLSTFHHSLRVALSLSPFIQILRPPDPAAGRGGHRVRLEPGKNEREERESGRAFPLSPVASFFSPTSPSHLFFRPSPRGATMKKTPAWSTCPGECGT